MSRSRLTAVISAVLFLGACERPPETVNFSPVNCTSTPLETTRTRYVNTTCAMRVGGNAFDHAKPCTLWNKRAVHERQQLLRCERAGVGAIMKVSMWWPCFWLVMILFALDDLGDEIKDAAKQCTRANTSEVSHD